MKKILIVLCTIALISGCGQKPPDEIEERRVKPASSEKKTADIDLTVMSGTMVYAEVYNITAAPEDYLGKTVKVKGTYVTDYYDVTDLTYRYVLIADAAACCQQGIEFILTGEYPDDYYPEEGGAIELQGVFKKYEELGITYYYLETGEIAKG